jgi:hypothetical protein
MSFWRPEVRDGRGRWVPVRTKLDHAVLLPLYVLTLLLLALAAWLIGRGEVGLAVMPSVFAIALIGFGLQRRHFLKTSEFFPGLWLLGGRCPSCDYQIGRVPPQEDGCTVCPECGAAWKITRGPGAPGHDSHAD